MDPQDCTLPNLLLVEDDPTSAAFLSDAAAQLPAQVHIARCIAEASAACRDQAFDLLLIDAHLPDGNGADLLRDLRATGVQVPALAHTAESGSVLHEQLLASGFRDVLRKPMSLGALHAALRRHLGASHRPVWDDAMALAALGDKPEQVAALRGLFLDELPGQRTRIASAASKGDEHAVREELHRLSASCGFVGATELAAAVRTLRAAPVDANALHALEAAIDALLALPWKERAKATDL